MPITLSPRPIREALSRVNSGAVLFWVIMVGLAVVTGALFWAMGNEMQELTVTIADECKRMGPNDLPACVAVLD